MVGLRRWIVPTTAVPRPKFSRLRMPRLGISSLEVPKPGGNQTRVGCPDKGYPDQEYPDRG